jgi:hypothetical protein
MKNYIILDFQNSLDILYEFIKNINNINTNLYLPNSNIGLNISKSHNFHNLFTDSVPLAHSILCNHFNNDLAINNLEWKFIILNSDCFFSYPTTINDVIIIPNNEYLKIHKNLTKTIIHERLHIFQRYNLNNWNKYILLNTRWKYFNIKNLPSYFIDNINKIKNNYLTIYNPDVNYINDFIYFYHDTNYFFGFHILSNNKLKYNWIMITNDKFIDLNNINNIKLPEHEHPMEILAYDYAEELSKFI